MKTTFVFILIFFLLAGCNTKESVVDEGVDLIPAETSLNLTAPRGIKIASDINALKEKYGIVGKIVTRIEFANPDEFGFSGDNEAGYLALVYYIDDDNRETNMAIAEGKFSDLLLKCANRKE